MIIDNFLDSFNDLKEASISGIFVDEVNPVDGVVYPLINKYIPENVKSEILQKLAILAGRPVEVSAMFMRRSPKGVSCPHQVHSDISMGAYSMMVYINGGHTGLVRHKKTGVAYSPEDQAYLDLITADQNNADAWVTTDVMGGEPNMAAIFNADRLHRAEPVGGFGEGIDSRVVLTCFFS